MTRFQEACITRCNEFISRHFQPMATFKKIEGESEIYYIGEIKTETTYIEIYVYSDEAGIMLNKKDWIPFERPDYDEDGPLIDSLIKKLSHIMQMERDNQ